MRALVEQGRDGIVGLTKQVHRFAQQAPPDAIINPQVKTLLPWRHNRMVACMNAWSGIEEFYVVAQALNFTQAARRLGVSASQVSREVARMEDRLGQRLLYRSTRHVSLTNAGARFLVHCRRLLEDRDEALATVIDESSPLWGQLRTTCSERFVVPMINRFMIRHPHFNAEVLLANEIMHLVDSGIDMAVRFGRLQDSQLVATGLGSRTRYLCAAPA